MSPQSGSKLLTHKDYTVGWVCALPKEQTAAKAMLEKTHPKLSKPSGDPNVYTFGSIGKHNIIIFCLPKGRYGNNLAATVVTSMLSTFKSVKFVLLVGIGGGVPPKVRLGDVVVGTPTDLYPGVVQWDMGRTTQGGKFERTGALDNPRLELLTALGALETEHDLNNGPKIPEYLEELRKTWPSLAPKYLRSESLKDVLYRADYDHVKKSSTEKDTEQNDENDENEEDENEEEYDDEEEDDEDESCRFCDSTKVLKRKPRDMRVHYGLIASGNQVIKYAKLRDKVNKDLGGKVLCFEMEAAGILIKCPCIVIRGICDYADSHKNEAWQKHAAAVAAAFAKEFLYVLEPQDVEEMPEVKAIKDIHRDVETEKILNWISPFRFTDNHTEILKDVPEGTGTGILKDPQFVEWIEGKGTTSKMKTLWCHGIPGAGKTVVAAIVSDHLRDQYAKDHPNIGVATIYCDYVKKDVQNMDNLQRSIYHQALEWMDEIPDDIRKSYKSASTKPPPLPSVKSLFSAFEALPSTLPTMFVVLDALDEANETVQDHIVEKIQKLPFPDIRLFCTSRPLDQFTTTFKDLPWTEIKATDEDITTFVNAQIDGSSRVLKLVKDDEEIRQEIVSEIIDKAKGMFLMAKLHIGSVMYASSQTDIRDALGDLSSGINDTYQKAMERIRSQPPSDRELAERTLSWVFGSRRSLNTIELQHSLAVVKLKAGREEVTKSDIPHEEIIITVCQGLLIQERKGDEKGFIRAVHYTAAEYFKEAYNKEFPHGHAEIAKACVAYLSLSGLSSILGSHMFELDLKTEDDDIAYYYGGQSIGRRPETWRYPPAIRRSFPLFFYAGEHWASHLCDANTLGLPISTSNIFWRYYGGSFGKWGDWLAPTKTSYDAKWYDDIYRIVFRSHNSVLTVLKNFTQGEHDINAVDEEDRTMLFYAVDSGHEDAINFLLSQDDIKIKEPELESNDPLSAAISRDLPGVVQSLLSMIAVRGEENEKDPKAAQGSKQPRGVYNLKRLRSLQVKATKTWSNQDNRILRMLLDKTKICDPKVGWDFLHLAITKGSSNNTEILAFVLERGLNLQARDDSGDTLLHKVARGNDQLLVKELLREGLDVEALNSTGWTPLQTALEAGSFFVLLQLLSSSTDGMRKSLKFNKQSSAWNGSDKKNEVERMVISLLLREEYTSAKDSGGRTALSWAAEYENYKSSVAMGFLLELTWDIDSSDNSGRTALSYAATNKHYEAEKLVQKLLEAGADPGRRDNFGKTPLLHAAEHFSPYTGDVVVRELLQAGADANAKDLSGIAVLEHIVRGKHLEMRTTIKTVEALLNAGADPNLKNDSCKTVLFFIVNKLHQLLKPAVSTTLVTSRRPFRKSIKAEEPDKNAAVAQEILWILLAAGADASIKDADGKTAKDYAREIANDSLSVIFRVDECLKLGSGLNSKDASGRTPLFFVTESNVSSGTQVRMVQALLRAGADPNIQDDNGRTPIFAAGSNEHGYDVWEALEVGGANIDVQDADGWRPYRSERRGGYAFW